MGETFTTQIQARYRDINLAGHVDNVEAVRELLALGANTTVRREDGATLLDAARIGTQPDRAEIRRLLLARMGRPPGWTDTPVDLPTPGRWYRAERTIGEPPVARITSTRSSCINALIRGIDGSSIT